MVSKEPAKGMKDILPAEMRLRNEVLDTMREVYRSFGFEQIETPCMERIDNLSCNQGGDNEKLVYVGDIKNDDRKVVAHAIFEFAAARLREEDATI